MKYFIYCRKSSEEESRQVQSLETQETALREYASKHNLEIVEVIKESKSAKREGNRPLFTKMLDRIRRGDANAILVHHVDRLSRNGIESGIITSLFDAGLLNEIRTPTQSYRSVTDMLYIDFDFVFAAHYSRNLSIRVKEGMKTKLAKGEYPTKAPPGYFNKNKQIFIDPPQARFIRMAFELYSSGSYSLRQLNNELYKVGFRSRYTGKKITKSLLYTILTNPVYYGAIRYNKTLFKGIHEPIISKSLFDAVQTILFSSSRPRKQKLDFLYRGYMICGNCGCKLTATRKKKKYDYYYCNNGKNYCLQNLSYLREKDIIDLISLNFKGITLDKELVDLAFDLYKDQLESSNNNDVEEHYQKLLKEVDQKIDRLVDLRLSDSITEELFTKKKVALENQKTEIKVQISNAKTPDTKITLELLENFKNRACSLDKMFKNGNKEVREDLLKSVLWNYQIKDKKILSSQYKLPYSIIQKAGKIDNLGKMLRS